MSELNLEDLGGDEIADDFIKALVAVIEKGQDSHMVYDLDRGIFIRISVERLTESQFDEAPGQVKGDL